jgi:hypothetical protein
MRTEESDRVRCAITYISSERPDPSPPRRIVANRWGFAAFSHRIPFNTRSLVKISKSFDSAASSIAIYSDRGGALYIWGAIDQHGRREAYIDRESRVGAESPGLLEVSIVGVGALEVYKDYALVAALRQGNIVVTFSDVLEEPGPVRAALQPAIDDAVSATRNAVGADVFAGGGHWTESIAFDWTTAVARILLGIQKYAHGGAILLAADSKSTGISLKYPLRYDRLGDALVRAAIYAIEHAAAEDKIHEDFLDSHADAMPVGLYLDASVSGNEAEDTREEIGGCIRFISSLSRVDGVVLMTQHLGVRGYGGIIRTTDDPPIVCVAQDVAATPEKLRPMNPQELGTRHQSMIRLCWRRPGIVGFVVSQDGDVRAMTRVGDVLVVWEDVKLRLA